MCDKSKVVAVSPEQSSLVKAVLCDKSKGTVRLEHVSSVNAVLFDRSKLVRRLPSEMSSVNAVLCDKSKLVSL